MSYLVLARKYRPQTFEEVYAQDHITKILRNTIELNRIAHAYLFTGPRGVGKTSLARIFSKSLNCLTDGPTVIPCNKCQNCEEITGGISSDVIEIDGASNTGVEDIRELQKELMYSTANSLYKIYIIDEVHMLSKNAFNALLKTLEEPPENVIFIFATTEPHKVIPTIISRCQRFDFKRIPIPVIIERLKSISKIENISIDDEALFTISKKADGSMRDALSLMDQIMAFGKDHITLDDVLSIFGIVHFDVYRDVLSAISNKESSEIINILHDILEKGNDIQEFINGLLDYVRDVLLLKIGINVQGISKEIQNTMKSFCNKFEENELLYLMTLLVKTKTDIKTSNNPILVAEMSFVKLSKLAELKSLDEILEYISSNNFDLKKKKNDFPEKEKIESEHTQSDFHQKTEEVKSEILKEAIEKKPKLDELTLEELQKQNNIIIEKIRKEKPFVVNYYINSKIKNVSNNFVHYLVPNQLSLKMLHDNKSSIMEILSNCFNLPIKVDFTLKEEKKEQFITNPTIDDIKRESPKLAEFIEITDSIIS